MEGKIDSEGRLWIQRKSELLMQQCPFDSSLADVNVQRSVACGSWCPLCGEPRHRKDNNVDCWSLTICQDRTLTFDKFTDERE